MESSDTPSDRNTNKNLSARAARINFPLSALGLFFLGQTVQPAPANAGIGSVIPFEESRKARFNGSITNFVVSLRLNRSLRKRGYSRNGAVVATFKPKDDLGALMARDYGSGFDALVDVSSDGSGVSVDDYLKECMETKKKAFIVYGQDVDIAPDGTVSEIRGEDVSKTEKVLIEQVGSRSMDVTLMGGIVIHRSKGGGKDAGEDCFLPMTIAGMRDGNVYDIFEEVYGDLPTARQTIVY